LDNLPEQPLLLFRRRCAHAVERRHAVLDAINSIEYQAMQMDVEIGRRTKTLNQRDRTGLRLGN
jgi:hypothetical protein